jgi:separase
MLAKTDADFMSLAKSSAASSGRVRFNRILADACFVSSVLAISNGNHKDAARHAKQCVVLNRRVWSALEAKNNARKTESGGKNSANSTFDPLSSMRNDKGVPLVMSTTHDALDGAEFWPIVPALYRGLMQQSTVYAHEGLLHEAMFFAEQAEKIASATRSRSLVLDNTSRRAEFWTHSGRPDKAKPLLDAIDLSAPYQHLAVVGYYSSLARMHHMNQDVDRELAAYEIMEALLNGLTMPSYIRSIDNIAPSVDTLAEQMSVISLVSSEPADKKPARSTRGRQPATKTALRPAPKLASKSTARATSTAAPKAARKVAQAVVPKTSSILEECSSLCNLQADVNRRRALANLLQDNVSEALILLDRAQDLEKGLDRNVLHLWTVFKITLSQSMKELAKNFTFNSLPESTIAFPAISQKDGAPLEGSLGKRIGAGMPATARGGKTKKPMNEVFIETLREARERLVEAHALCSTTGSSHSFQQASYALSHVTVLLSAVSSGEMRGSLHPLYAAYMSGMC